MNVLLIYTYAATGFMVSFMAQRYAVSCLRFLLNPKLLWWFERQIVSRRLWRRRALWGPMGFFRMFLHILHVAGTLVCNVIGVHDWSEASLRAGSLALLHIIPTLVSPHLSLVAHYMGVPISIMNLFHTSAGFMVLLQSVIHVIISVKTMSLDVTNRQMQHGLVAALAILLLVLIAFSWFRNLAHEITIKTHFALAILAGVMLWLHIPFAMGYNTVCLMVASSIFTFHLVVFLTRFGVRNFVARKSLSTAEIIKHEGAVELIITPARPWKVLPGQYVYISVPAVRVRSFADPFTMVRSFMEAHPFTVIWWEEGTDGNAEQFSVLVKAESGFTKALAETTHRQLRLCIDGPYGVGRNLDKYSSIHNSILMIATGIGIAAHIPYVKHLIDSFPNMDLDKNQGRRRSIYIVWEVDEEYYEDWVAHWMDELFYLDKRKGTMALNVSLYVLNRSKEHYKDGDTVPFGQRGTSFYGKPDLKAIIEQEQRKCLERLLVTVSADDETRDVVRDTALSLGSNVDLHEMEFQPSNSRNTFWAPRRQVQKIPLSRI